MPSTIKITKCDNELILVAYQFGGSYEICHILSGNSQAVNVTLQLIPGQFNGGLLLNGVTTPLKGTFVVPLDQGKYKLAAVGINWGGPQEFALKLNTHAFSLPQSPTGEGVAWIGGTLLTPPPLASVSFTV